MKNKLFVLSVILITIFLSNNILLAQENVRPPFELKSFSISMMDLKERTALIEISSDFLSNGDVEASLYLPDEFKIKQGNKKLNPKNMGRGETLNNQWIVQIPEEGYYLIEININVRNQKLMKDEQIFTNYHSFPMYVEISDGYIVKYDYKQDPKFTAPTIEDKKEPKDKKPFATPIPFDKSSLGITQKVINQKVAGVTSYIITVSISGQVNHAAAVEIIKGVPNAGVYLDWDYDNNVNTGYTPYYGGNTLHVDYDVTDMNGYYYFSFSFQSDHPANYYSQRIRVYANNANSAAFDGDLGNGAKFGVYYYLDISSLTTYVYSNSASLRVDSYQGGALRNLYRIKQFSINGMGFNPGTIRYYIRSSQNTSYFCGSGNCGNGINVSVPYILFNRIPDSHLGYHEYGHFVEYSKVGFTVGTGVSHSFTWVTDIGTAWTEGWAEFFEAAAHNYFYSAELPSQLEYLSRGEYDAYKEFCDYSQLFVTGGTGNDNTKVEGAVACFFYSLWDGISTRAPNYIGDNDDINLSGSFILNKLADRYNILGQLLGSSHIESFKIALTNSLNTQQGNSVQALYNWFILQNGIAKSATPTVLNISGNFSSRTLTWNDNTSQSVYSYPREGGYTPFYDIVENQELNFRIYRKPSSGTWDGTLNGYSLVGTVAQNITSYNDNTQLAGNYSYVVVSYNSAGNSIPKAEKSVYYPPTLTATMSGPSYLASGQSGTFVVTASGGTPPYSYAWSYYVYCNAPVTNPNGGGTIEPNAFPCGYWFNISNTTNTVTRISDGRSFQMKCIVRDANNSTVTVTKDVGGSLSKSMAMDSTNRITNEIKTELLNNFPNPFNPSTIIKYSLKDEGRVTVKIFNTLGEEIRTLVDEIKLSGNYNLEFNANNLPSGVYIYRLQSGEFVSSKKMLLIK